MKLFLLAAKISNFIKEFIKLAAMYCVFPVPGYITIYIKKKSRLDCSIL